MLVEYPDPHVQQSLLVFVTVLHSIAVITTCLRLCVRIQLRRLWWDDAWAVLAMCMDVVCAVSTWMLTLPERDRPWCTSQASHIVLVWSTLLSQTCLTWAARTSIVLALPRALPPPSRMRTAANGLAALLFFLWALCAASKVYTCGVDRSWYNNLPDPQCPIGFPIAIIEFTAEVIADIGLVMLPAWILWQNKLPRNERLLVLSVFWMSSLSTLVSIVHIAFLIPVPGYTASLTADIEGALVLVISNLLVLVTRAYCFFRNEDDIEITDNYLTATSPGFCLSSRTAMDSLTTVDLECLETLSVHSTKSAPPPQSKTLVCHLSPRSSLDIMV